MTTRERFVPRPVADIVRSLESTTPAVPGDADGRRWASLCRIVGALYHFEFHEVAQRTNDAWQRVADDSDAADQVTGDLTGLLDGANFTALDGSELERAMEEEALIPLRLDVDFDLYDELLVYRRGERTETVEQKRFLRSAKALDITVDDQVVVHSRIKPVAWFEQHGRDPDDCNVIAGDVSLKQFRNVPRADIEMLLPSTTVRFRRIDTLKIAIPAIVSAIIVLATKLLPTLVLLFFLAGFYLGLVDEERELDQAALLILLGGGVALTGFVLRQWTKLKNRRIDYLKTLSESLYFRTVADGPGVFQILLSSAEEQEVTEVLVAYRLLLVAEASPTAEDLDLMAERWLNEAFDVDVDFEIDDALDKLVRLGIATEDRTGRWTPVDLDQALAQLDRRWDDLFRFDAPVDSSTDDPADGDDSGDGSDDDAGDALPTLIRLRRVVDRFRNRLGDRETQDA